MNTCKYPRWLPIAWLGFFLGLAGYCLLSDDSSKSSSTSDVTTASLTQANGLPSPTVFRGRAGGGEGEHEPSYITKPIRDVQVGDWVLAENPELAGVEFEEQTVDEATWRSIDFEMSKPNGGLLQMTFLRPVAWLHANQIELGSTIDLNLEEISAKGPAYVRAIGPCPQLLPRPGPRHQLVTGKYQHSADKILNVYVEGLSEPIGTTPEHPFWSEDRQAFVEAGSLQVGENLKTANGNSAAVLDLVVSRLATVFNLEVNNQHVFFVTEKALLVHNQYDTDNVVYRALREGENPLQGLRARSPGENASVASHIMGLKQSDLISTTRDKSKAMGLFNGGHGVVAIDLNRVPAEVIDASAGIGAGRVYSRSRSHREVLIRDNGGAAPPIPPEAITVLQGGH